MTLPGAGLSPAPVFTLNSAAAQLPPPATPFPVICMALPRADVTLG